MNGMFMNGIINVYKEKGYTSHDVVAKLRRICHQKKIGHTGTLDPDAEGVLVVCLGTATKVCGLLTDKDKVYEAVLLLGKETDTQDTGGMVLREVQMQNTAEEVQAAVQSFHGAYSQIPPMYSALKVNGKKLCDLARAGVEVERSPRQVFIYEIEILWMQLPRVKLRVHCSKGTYIRTLCHDIGQKLGCGGCMEELRRTKVSIFELEHALTLAQIQELAEENRLQEIVQPVDSLFTDHPAVQVKPQFQKMLQNGNRLPEHALFYDGTDRTAPVFETGQTYRVYLGQQFYGLYMADTGHGDYKPVKIFGQCQLPETEQKQPDSKRRQKQLQPETGPKQPDSQRKQKQSRPETEQIQPDQEKQSAYTAPGDRNGWEKRGNGGTVHEV